MLLTCSSIGQGKLLTKPIKFNVTISFYMFDVSMFMRALLCLLDICHVRNLQQNLNMRNWEDKIIFLDLVRRGWFIPLQKSEII